MQKGHWRVPHRFIGSAVPLNLLTVNEGENLAVRIPFQDDYYAVSTFTFVISPQAKGAGHKFWREGVRESENEKLGSKRQPPPMA